MATNTLSFNQYYCNDGLTLELFQQAILQVVPPLVLARVKNHNIVI